MRYAQGDAVRGMISALGKSPVDETNFGPAAPHLRAFAYWPVSKNLLFQRGALVRFACRALTVLASYFVRFVTSSVFWLVIQPWRFWPDIVAYMPCAYPPA